MINKEDLIEGKVYFKEKDSIYTWFIYRYYKKYSQILYQQNKGFNSKELNQSYHFPATRVATIEEIEHLDLCISVNHYVPYIQSVLTQDEINLNNLIEQSKNLIFKT